MISIRHGVFETNSSSTHTLCICPTSVYKEWLRGGVYYNIRGKSDTQGRVFTKEEVVDYICHESEVRGYKSRYSRDEILAKDGGEFARFVGYRGFYTIDSYNDLIEDGDCVFEEYEENYTTPSGDEITIFGYCGYDG